MGSETVNLVGDRQPERSQFKENQKFFKTAFKFTNQMKANQNFDNLFEVNQMNIL